MDKTTYMNELRRAMGQFDNTTAEEVIGDYEEHFVLGLQAGRTEEEICAELGNIEELVREIAALQLNRQQIVPKTEQTAGGGEEKRTADWNGAGGYTGGQDGTYMGGEGVKGCRRVEIEGICAEVAVVQSPDTQIHISYENYGSPKQKMMYEFYSRQEGDVLRAGITRRSFSTGIFWQFTGHTDMKILLKVPADLDSIKIRTASGDMRAENILIKELLLNTASGDIIVTGIQTGRGIWQTMSGDVNVENCAVQDADWSSKSGDINGTSLQCTSLRASSLSGDVGFSSVDMKEGRVKSTSGDLKLNRIKAVSFEGSSISGDCVSEGFFQSARLSSTSGEVYLTANSDLKAELSSISGDVIMTLNNNGNGYDGNFSSISGDISIRYAGEYFSFRRSCKYSQGNKGSEVNIRTTSGDIQLRG